MAASAQLRCSWLSPLPAPHRTPEAEAGRGRGPASTGGGGAEWEEEGAARGTLSQGCLRIRASSLGSLAESGRQGGQLLALPLRKGKLRPGRCLGTPALLGIPGPPLVTLGRSVPGELETQVHSQVPTCFPPTPFSSFPLQQRNTFQPGVWFHLSSHPWRSLPFQSAADPLLLCTRSPDPRIPVQSFRGPRTPAWALCAGNQGTQVQPGVNLNSRVKRQLPGPGCFQIYYRELFVELF